MKHAKHILISTFLILLITVLAGACATISGNQVNDREGRFTYTASDQLQRIEDNEAYDHYYLEDRQLHSYVVTGEGETKTGALRSLFHNLGQNMGDYSEEGSGSMGDWTLKIYLHKASGKSLAAAFQYRVQTVYALVVESDDPDVDPGSPPSAVMNIIKSFEFTSKAGEQFSLKSETELLSHIDQLAEDNGGALSLSVMNNGRSVYDYTAGIRSPGQPATADTAFNWGSITKILTTTAVMGLIEEGRLSLDTPISDYFPDFPYGRQIQIHHLLSHSSGLADLEVIHLIGTEFLPLPDYKILLQDYASELDDLLFSPGTSSYYANVNFLILGIIFEEITGESLTRSVTREIVNPLGMTHAAYSYAELADLQIQEARSVATKEQVDGFITLMGKYGKDGSTLIAETDDQFIYLDQFNILPLWGGFRSAAGDAARFGQMFISDNGDNTILSGDSKRAMLTMSKSDSGEPLGFGLGWILGEDDYGVFAEHAGGGPGIHSLLRVYPEKGISIAVLATVMDYNPELIIKTIMALELNQ